MAQPAAAPSLLRAPLTAHVGQARAAAPEAPAPAEPRGYVVDFLSRVRYHPDPDSALLMAPAPAEDQAAQRRRAEAAGRAYIPWVRVDLRPDCSGLAAARGATRYYEAPAGPGADGPVRLLLSFAVEIADGSADVVLEFVPRPGEPWCDAASRLHPALAARPEWPAIARSLLRIEQWHRGEQALRRTGHRLVTGYERFCRQQAERGGDAPGAEAGRWFLATYPGSLPPLPRVAALAGS